MSAKETAKALIASRPPEPLAEGEVFVQCRDWCHAYDMVRDLRYEGVYGRQPLSVPGIIVFASKLEP